MLNFQFLISSVKIHSFCFVTTAQIHKSTYLFVGDVRAVLLHVTQHNVELLRRWDSDCVQQWLRLDDSRSALQQQLEYDAAAAELEDWSMEEDMWRHTHLAHSQTLPSIQVIHKLSLTYKMFNNVSSPQGISL